MSAAAVQGALATKVTGIFDQLGLSREEVGQIVDASARSVSRWSMGEVVPQKLNKQRLLELAYVADAVTEIMPAEQANIWMFTPSRLLSHETPADCIHQGRYRDVLNLIEAIAEGVVI